MRETRQAAIKELIHQADIVDGLFDSDSANVVRSAAAVAAALNDLYRIRWAREGSRDQTAREAMANAIEDTLEVTSELRESSYNALRQAANDIELGLLSAFTYNKDEEHNGLS